MRQSSFGYAIAVLLQFGLMAQAVEIDAGRLIETIKRVDKYGVGHRDATAAIRQLQQAEAAQLLGILRGMNDAGPLAANWLRGAFETIAQRELRAGKLDKKTLEAFVLNLSHGDQSRRLAYELLTRADSSAPDRLLPKMLDDPSLELQYDALARRLKEIETNEKGAAPATVAARYREALTSARDTEQIKAIVEKLKKLGEEVDLARHFGFVRQWKLIGPFDNAGGKGFAAEYPPEKNVDFAAAYEGKSGSVRWKDVTTDDPYGLVDLNRTVGKHMGAVVYAAAEFASERQRPIELRMGCINACKIWLNGELLLERDVYHTGMDVDQYVGKGKLKRGRNTILVKVCQNEQTEDWAQSWQFQLRVCDSRGTAVLSQGSLAAGDRTNDPQRREGAE